MASARCTRARLAAVAILIAVLAGCATGGPPTVPASADYDQAVRSNEMPAGTGRLVLSKDAVPVTPADIVLNNLPIGAIGPTEYLAAELAPGRYVLQLYWRYGDGERTVWDVQVMPGESLFLRIGGFVLPPRPLMRLGDASDIAGRSPVRPGISLAGLRPIGAAVAGAKPISPPAAGGNRPANPDGEWESSATGFVVGGRHVLTNAHVVEGCREVRVRFADGEVLAAETRREDKVRDLALLRLAAARGIGAQLADDRSVRLGDAVVVFGYPLSNVLASSGSLTTGVVSALAGVGDDTGTLQLTAPVQPGNSGGPVFDGRGNVIGVVVSQLGARVAGRRVQVPQNVNFAVKSSVARAFLELNQIEVPAAGGTTALDVPSIGELARKVTVRVECR